MLVYYITFQSQTAAQRASDLLKYRGIHAPVVSTPASLSPEGCGYSIKLKEKDLTRAKGYLDRMLISYQNIYFGGNRK